jgi:hypothetical protein
MLVLVRSLLIIIVGMQNERFLIAERKARPKRLVFNDTEEGQITYRLNQARKIN